MMKPRSLMLIMALVCSLFIFAACAPEAEDPEDPEAPEPEEPEETEDPDDEEDEEDKDGGTLTVALPSNPVNIDPRLQWDSTSMLPLSNVVDRFYTVDDDDELRPLAATDWYANEDADKFTFELREGVRYHDGTEMTSETIAEVIRWTAEKDEYPQAQFWTNLDRVETPDDHTLVIHTTEPISPAEFWRERQYSPWPISLEQQEEHGDEGVRDPVGAGPFKFVSYTSDDQIVLERNEDYWAGPPHLDELIFRIIPDASTRRVEMEAGTIDVLPDVEPRDVAEYEDMGLNVQANEAPIRAMVSVNFKNEILQDMNVRQAIAHALNRDAIIERLFHGYATKAINYQHPNSPYYDDTVEGYEYDPARAEELLEESGWMLEGDYRYRDGERLELEIASRDHDTWDMMSQIMEDQLREIGIDADVNTTDTTAFHNAVRDGTYDICYWVLHGNAWDQMGHPNLQTDAWGNISHMRDSKPEIQDLQDEINDLIMEFEGALTEDTRESTTVEMQHIINENLVVIPLWFPHRIHVTQPYVQDLEMPAIRSDIRYEDAWLSE